MMISRGMVTSRYDVGHEEWLSGDTICHHNEFLAYCKEFLKYVIKGDGVSYCANCKVAKEYKNSKKHRTYHKAVVKVVMGHQLNQNEEKFKEWTKKSQIHKTLTRLVTTKVDLFEVVKGAKEGIAVGILRLLGATNLNHVLVKWLRIMFDSLQNDAKYNFVAFYADKILSNIYWNDVYEEVARQLSTFDLKFWDNHKRIPRYMKGYDMEIYGMKIPRPICRRYVDRRTCMFLDSYYPCDEEEGTNAFVPWEQMAQGRHKLFLKKLISPEPPKLQEIFIRRMKKIS
eukprot:Gb_28350 [translate_table: standard]